MITNNQTISATPLRRTPHLRLERDEEAKGCCTIPNPSCMKSINRVILVGHVAADPESTNVAAGKKRVTFPVATSRDTASDGTKRPITDFHRVCVWGGLANACETHLTRGQAVYVEGSIAIVPVVGSDGERRYVPEIWADEVNSLTWKRQSKTGSVEVDRLDASHAEHPSRKPSEQS